MSTKSSEREGRREGGRKGGRKGWRETERMVEGPGSGRVCGLSWLEEGDGGDGGGIEKEMRLEEGGLDE